jgi:hypothetical protein
MALYGQETGTERTAFTTTIWEGNLAWLLGSHPSWMMTTLYFLFQKHDL